MPKVKSKKSYPKPKKISLPIEAESPKVSVILSSYNHADYIAAAIESVLNQTFTDFELLIYDDGSTDNSREIIKNFDDPRIKTFLYEENRGPRIAAMDSLRAARGKYLAVHHSDDVWHKDKLQKQVAFLEEHEEYAACFTWAEFIDEDGNLQELDEGDFYKGRFDQANRSRAEWLNYFFYNSNCLCHPSLLIRHETYQKYHLLDIIGGLWQLPDYAMWIEFCFRADFYILNEMLVQFRLRLRQRDNMSAATFDKRVRVESETYFVLKNFLKNFHDDKFFLKVFPNAEKFIVDGKINRNFAFAQICLENPNTPFSSAFQFFALNLLKKIISNEKDAAQVKKLYDYDEKSFFRDTGNYDVFDLVQKLSMLQGYLYLDTGEGFNGVEMIAKSIFVDVEGKFQAKYIFDSDKPIKHIRFDPGENFISLRIGGIKINGIEQSKFFVPSSKSDGEFYNFLTSDPQIIIPTENLTGKIIFEISAKMDKNYFLKLNGYFEEKENQIVALHSENIELYQWGKGLEKVNEEFRLTNENLNTQIQNLNTQIQSLNVQNENLNAQVQNLNSQNENLNTQIQNLNSQKENLNAQVQDLNSQKENLNSQNENLNSQNENLRTQIQNLNTQLQNATEHINNIAAENQRLNGILNEVFDSNSWKMTEPLRKLGRWLRADKKDKALSVARLFYKAMPLDAENKTKLKDNFYKKFSPILKNTNHYQIWLQTQNMEEFKNSQQIVNTNEKNKFIEMLEEQPGKIAIHAHIFYLDLAEEIANYFSNMPYKFDALISIIEPTAEQKIKETFGKIKNVEKLIVRVVPNRGRDVAPFICGFGDILLNYDFVAHIHSKKSLYTGAEQKNWRNYLFDALLGSGERIKKFFHAFNQNKNVGLIYPKPAENVPYPAFTWLSNRKIGTYLLNKIGVPQSKTEYFDFPAGTMFWARTAGLKKFIDNLSIEDFVEERGQNDGTLAHAFERAVALTVTSEKMHFYEFDPELETYTINIGSKNMWQYYSRSDIELQWVLNHGEIVSFDLFDTLFMRRLAVPYLVNDLIKFKVEDLLNRDFDFTKFRLQAEESARQKKNADVTLDDIYKSFAELTKLDEDTCKKIRELEIETEIEIILPRKEMVSWFNRIRRQGRKIWFISDMYLQTSDIEKLLQKCGISGYEKLLISCETGMRKDTAAIWNHLVEKGFADGKLVHVGDNEMSDFQLLLDRNISTYHIMNAVNLFSQVPFGRMFFNASDRKISLYAGMLLGTILAEKFQDPFQLHDTGGRLIIKNFSDLGYWFYGPPILTFMLWVIKKSSQENIQQILFLARDGYFLQPLYKLLTKLLNVEELPNNYFYASRRAVTVASIREISETDNLINLNFEGTVKNFFEARFGIEIDDETEIHLPDVQSANLLKKIIADNAEEILSRAADERKNYEVYINSLGKQFEKIAAVDMGYSGTIQFHLQKILQKNLIGYYFATNSKNLFGAEAFKKIHGCFTENDDYGTTKSSVYKYHLLFEAILTAPDSQLKYFDANGKPIFGNPEPAQFQIEDIRQVHEGIKAFCRDAVTHFGKYLLRTEIDCKFIDVWVRSFVHDENIIAPEIKKIFAFDDTYCNLFTGNALDLYMSDGV